MEHRDTRTESDSMGTVEVPADALYGSQTARAVRNFPISGEPLPSELVSALGLVKWAAAQTNQELGLLSGELAAAIAAAAEEVIDGKLDAHFPVDVFQTGSGTSSNMNANEVIANRANQILGAPLGQRSPVHPNDHVNLGQSSNDVIPTAIHVAAALATERNLLPALSAFESSLQSKADEFEDVVKIGRTHLQDAVPITAGQEFCGFVGSARAAKGAIEHALLSVRALALGGTAVGTGLNTHPDFGRRVAARLTRRTGLEFGETDNHFAAQASLDGPVALSSSLRQLATAMMRIANDIRWLSSGPRLGIGELIVPAVQPGSSIMPGKVNPVLCEATIMAGAQVLALDCGASLSAVLGNFQLNTMQPLVGRNLLEQIRLCAGSLDALRTRCIDGLQVQRERIERRNASSLALATALVPLIGYDRAAEIAKRAHDEGKNIRDVALESGELDEAQLDDALDLRRQTGPSLLK